MSKKRDYHHTTKWRKRIQPAESEQKLPVEPSTKEINASQKIEQTPVLEQQETHTAKNAPKTYTKEELKRHNKIIHKTISDPNEMQKSLADLKSLRSEARQKLGKDSTMFQMLDKEIVTRKREIKTWQKKHQDRVTNGNSTKNGVYY